MFPEHTQLALFVVSSLALLLLPGPAVFYIVARSVAQGRGAGLVSTLGVGAGSMVHVLAAALGISALLASSAEIFSMLRLAGAAYLVYLGIRALRKPVAEVGAAGVVRTGLRGVFREGVIVNVLNPKTAMFFVAFLPQFADPARGPVGVQILILGVAFVVMGIVTDGAYALASNRMTQSLARTPRAQRLKNRIAAGVYFGLGALTLNVETPRSS